MGQVIEGRSGHPVDSNEKGELLTHATTESSHLEAAHDGDAYFFPLDGVGTNGAEHICVIRNTGTRKIHVSAVTLFVASFKDTTRVKVLLNETFSYLAEGTKVTPTNLVSGLVGGAVGDFYKLAAAGTDITTFAGTSTLGGIYVFERYPISMRDPGGWDIPPGQVFSLFNVGNDNTFYGGIDFYYHS